MEINTKAYQTASDALTALIYWLQNNGLGIHMGYIQLNHYYRGIVNNNQIEWCQQVNNNWQPVPFQTLVQESATCRIR